MGHRNIMLRNISPEYHEQLNDLSETLRELGSLATHELVQAEQDFDRVFCPVIERTDIAQLNQTFIQGRFEGVN